MNRKEQERLTNYYFELCKWTHTPDPSSYKWWIIELDNLLVRGVWDILCQVTYTGKPIPEYQDFLNHVEVVKKTFKPSWSQFAIYKAVSPVLRFLLAN